jgi:Leucine-rich repeat (LRR) protein
MTDMFLGSGLSDENKCFIHSAFQSNDAWPYDWSDYCASSGYTYVPDDNFEQALIDLGYDDTLDNYVVTDSINSVTDLDVSNDSISDLTGIEGFTALTELDCSENQLTSLNMSSNTALNNLYCNINQLTALNVSSNTALNTLYCYDNQLDSLDVSNNTSLINFDGSSNQLTSLNVSQNIALLILSVQNNQLDSLDVSSNTALSVLRFSHNQLTDIDVSSNTSLTNLDCFANQLDSLDLSTNTALTSLGCSYNDLTVLDVSNNTALTNLNCSGNELTALDVSNNTALLWLYCGWNGLTAVDMSNNTSLRLLTFNSNDLTSLDVSNNTELTTLDCSDNELTYLNMRNGITDALTTFDATDNTSLTCIETLDPDYATANWTYANGNIDEGVTFAVDCTPDPPTLVINEILARNVACCTDANGDYDSYIELYNYGDEEVDIGGIVITDDLNNYDHYYQIPTNNDSTIILSGGFLLLWADEESEQGVLHVEIELLSRGGEVGLFMPDSTTVVDNITYGSQSDDDVAYGRYPDSSATWQFMDPTPGATNTQELSLNDNIVIPSQYTLHQNYPNPFNPITTLRYDLPENSLVNITIYDMLGRQVKTLINQTQGAGYKSAIWDATDEYGKPVSAGIYLYQIQAGKYNSTKKMVLLK